MPFQKALENWNKIRPNTFAGYSQVPNINLINSAEKKKPHNIQIDNNRKEPKVKANTKYSEKHNFRRYKTKIEPSLHSRILINEEDDIIGKIREAFGLEGKKPNTNYAEVETAPAGSMITNVEEEPVSHTVFGSGTRARKLHNYSVDEIENMDMKSIEKLMKSANKNVKDIFAQLYDEKTREINRSLDDEEALVLVKRAFQRNIQQRHSIDDISKQDQEELTGQSSPTSPSRPYGSAIVKFPEPARSSGSDFKENFFMSARGIIPEDKLTELHGLKPVDKMKLYQFSPQEAKNFTIDEIINSSVGELKGFLKQKAARILSPHIVKTRAQTELQRQKEAAMFLSKRIRSTNQSVKDETFLNDHATSLHLFRSLKNNNNKNPQMSLKDVQSGLLEKQKRRTISELVQREYEKELLKPRASKASSELSDALNVLMERRRGRPPGAVGIAKRQKEIYKVINQGKKSDAPTPSYQSLRNTMATSGWGYKSYI